MLPASRRCGPGGIERRRSRRRGHPAANGRAASALLSIGGLFGLVVLLAATAPEPTAAADSRPEARSVATVPTRPAPSSSTGTTPAAGPLPPGTEVPAAGSAAAAFGPAAAPVDAASAPAGRAAVPTSGAAAAAPGPAAAAPAAPAPAPAAPPAAVTPPPTAAPPPPPVPVVEPPPPPPPPLSTGS
jgi:hypothetical protein